MKKRLTDILGNPIDPLTLTESVSDPNGDNLDNILDDINSRINNIATNAQSDYAEADQNSSSYIKNKPTALPANGGNSDTVDGKHASEFAIKEDFDLHTTSLSAHENLFGNKLDTEVANSLIKETGFDPVTGILTFTRLNGTTITFNIPKSLVFKSALFDEGNNEIVITWSDDSKSRIPVNGLIDVYTGSENDVIQILVNENTNVISGIIKNGSIIRTLLSSDVQTDLGKAHSHDNKSVIDKFTEDTSGNVLYDGKAISSNEQSGGEITVKDYTDLTNKPKINNVELNGNKTLSDLGINASSIGADSFGSAASALKSANEYTDSLETLLIENLNTKVDETKFNNSLNNKVDKIEGMGLSENNFTVVDKNKLQTLPNFEFVTSLPENLQNNTIYFVYEEY